MGAAFAMVFTLSDVTFAAIKATIGIRVSAEDEEAGLDIASHGMYGDPEQFIRSPSWAACRPRRRHGMHPPLRRSRRACGPGGDGMKMIVAYICHEAFEPIRTDLLEAGFPSLTITEVKGSGRQKAITEHYRGSELAVHLRPK